MRTRIAQLLRKAADKLSPEQPWQIRADDRIVSTDYDHGTQTVRLTFMAREMADTVSAQLGPRLSRK